MDTLLPLIITILTASLACIAIAILSSCCQKTFYARVLQARRVLPGSDCGVCGYPGCIDFAEAAASGAVQPGGCIPGGPKTAHALADLMGTTVENSEPMMAAVHCKGGVNEVAARARYYGINDCHAAILLANGPKACHEGCLGLGSCVEACPFGAISINDNNVAIVDRHKCTGCGICIGSCPRALLSLVPHVHKIFLACSVHTGSERVKEWCTVGCTSCGKCVEATPSGAITMVDHLPTLDYFTPNENFVAAVHACPSHSFVDTIKVRPKANIDTKCDGCGACITVCPVEGAIDGRSGHRHIIQKDRCIGCGRCLNSCHVRAISLWGSLGYQSQKNSKK
ncbi:MAG: 4Fe-4S binding protein [Chitinispirillaceae bacterium]|nr:4Fe-4S binding protein [Chitinispirillaceae bacterium]